MRSIAEDIRDMLDASSIGVPRFPGKLPDTPDRCISILDSGGIDALPLRDAVYRRPFAQVTIRGEQNSYSSATTLAEAVITLLCPPNGIAVGPGQVTIGGSRYIGIWQQGDLMPLGEDPKKRWRFALNLRIHRTDAAE